MKVLPGEWEACPVCGNAAVLEGLPKNERFECASCLVVCCITDGRGDRCALCLAAQVVTTAPDQPHPNVVAAAPKMKFWHRLKGAHENLWRGQPGFLGGFTVKPVLVRATKDGKVLFVGPFLPPSR